MRAVPCALAAQTRGGVDSRDERRTLASEVLRMSRALHEVLRMSCERYKQRRFRRKRPHNSAIFFNKIQKGTVFLDALAYGKHGHHAARDPIFPIFRPRDSHFRM